MATPTTDLELVNIALSKIGHTVQVVNLSTDDTLEARTARIFLDIDRDRALGVYRWKWADQQKVLTEVTTEAHDRWAHLYSRPTDYVVGRQIYPNARLVNPEIEIPFDGDVIKKDGTGKLIGCDLAPVAAQADGTGGEPLMFYTARISTVAIYPQMFVDFFTWLLASSLAMPLVRERKVREDALKETRLSLVEAIRVDLMSSRKDVDPATPSAASRGGYPLAQRWGKPQ